MCMSPTTWIRGGTIHTNLHNADYFLCLALGASKPDYHEATQPIRFLVGKSHNWISQPLAVNTHLQRQQVLLLLQVTKCHHQALVARIMHLIPGASDVA